MTPAALLSKLLGPRKPATAAAIAAEIEARRAALARVQATVAAAAQARADSLASLDTDGMARAEAEGAEAGRAVEVGALALDLLSTAHGEAVQAERRRDQARVAAVLVAEGDALAAEFRAEWDRAAARLAGLRHRAALHDLKIENALFAGAVELGAVPGAEEFRRALLFRHSMPAVVALDGTALWPAPIPESDRARAEREAAEEHARRRAERDAKRADEAKARDETRTAERQAARDLDDERERSRYFPAWREHMDMGR